MSTLYTIDRVIHETGQLFSDRSHIVYVNGEHRDVGTALGKLVHDIFCTKPEEMYYSALAERVRYFKEEGEGVSEVSEVMERLLMAEEVKHKAAMREQIKNVAQRMLEAGEIAIDKIAEYTGLSVSTVQSMAEKLGTAQA